MPADGQHSKSIHVKVDTGTGSNIVLLPVFWHLYPTKGRPDGTPSGLSHYRKSEHTVVQVYCNMAHWIQTQCGRHKPGANCKCKQVWYIETQWYVADTPDPAIVGLPTSTALHIIDLNCTVDITQVQQPLLGQYAESEVSKPVTDGLHTITTDTPYEKWQPQKTIQTSPKKTVFPSQRWDN